MYTKLRLWLMYLDPWLEKIKINLLFPFRRLKNEKSINSKRKSFILGNEYPSYTVIFI